jgi:hypothetical protein
MSEVDSAERRNSVQTQLDPHPRVGASQGDARKAGPPDHQLLYLLGLGVAGAILANAALACFALCHAPR